MSTEIGQRAEGLAAEWLKRQGFKILARNWRTRWCEIDIIAQEGKVIHFVEVKFRKSDRHGTAMEYVTTEKQRRLRSAASAWLVENPSYEQYQIDVLAVTGWREGPKIDFLANAVEDIGVL